MYNHLYTSSSTDIAIFKFFKFLKIIKMTEWYRKYKQLKYIFKICPVYTYIYIITHTDVLYIRIQRVHIFISVVDIRNRHQGAIPDYKNDKRKFSSETKYLFQSMEFREAFIDDPLSLHFFNVFIIYIFKFLNTFLTKIFS